MTAELVTWGGDAMPDAVAVGPAAGSTFFATPRRVAEMERRALDGVEAMRQGAVTLVEALAELRSVNAHIVREFDTWHEYVEHLLGDRLREVKFLQGATAVAERKALVQSMRATEPKSTPMRVIADRLGVSLGTVAGDIAPPASGGGAQVVALRDAEPDPYEGLTRTREALARVAAQGDRGLTSIELDHETGWPMGTATASLSRLERRGLIRRQASHRANRAAYAVTDLGAAALDSGSQP